MFCNNCGNQLPDGAKFCNVCGAAIQTPVSKAPVTQQPQVPQEPFGHQSNFTNPCPPDPAPVNPTPAKKKKTGLVIGIVFAVVFAVIAVVGGLIGTGVISTEGSTPIERGTIEGNTYVNESINLEFEKPDDWTFYSDEELTEAFNTGSDLAGYSDFQQAIAEQKTVYEMGAKNAYGANLLLVFEKATSGVGEEGYLDLLNISINNQSTFEYEFTDQREVNLGDETYIVADLQTDYYSSTIYQRYYIRKQGNYMISVIVSAASTSELDEIEAMFS